MKVNKAPNYKLTFFTLNNYELSLRGTLDIERYQVVANIAENDQCLTGRQIAFQDLLYQHYSERRRC